MVLDTRTIAIKAIGHMLGFKVIAKVITLAFFAAWSVQVSAADFIRPKVLASIKPVELMVKAIAGDQFQVDTLLAAGRNPHSQTMTLLERQKVSEADLVVWLGVEFERFLAKPMASGDVPSLALGQIPDLSWPHSSSNHAAQELRKGLDLHLWLSPANVDLAYMAIAQQLKLLNPLATAAIEKNLFDAREQLRLTTAQIASSLAALKDYAFGVNHDGFSHFVAAFSLNQVAAVSQLPEQQLSVRSMLSLRKQMQGARCLVVDTQTTSNMKLANTLGVAPVVIDALGRAEHIASIESLLFSVANGFEQCLSQ